MLTNQTNSQIEIHEVAVPKGSPIYPNSFPKDMRYYHGYVNDTGSTSPWDSENPYLKYTYTGPEGDVRAAEIRLEDYNAMLKDPKTKKPITDPKQIRDSLTQRAIEAYTLEENNMQSSVSEIDYDIPYYDINMYLKHNAISGLPTITEQGVTKVAPEILALAKQAYNSHVIKHNNDQYSIGISDLDYLETFNRLLQQKYGDWYYVRFDHGILNTLKNKAKVPEYKIDLLRTLKDSNIPSLTGDVVMSYFDGVDSLSTRAQTEFYLDTRISQHNSNKNLYLKKAILRDLCKGAGAGYQQLGKQLDSMTIYDFARQEDLMDQYYENLIASEYNFIWDPEIREVAEQQVGNWRHYYNDNSSDRNYRQLAHELGKADEARENAVKQKMQKVRGHITHEEWANYPYQVPESEYKKYMTEDIKDAESVQELVGLHDALKKDSKSLQIDYFDAENRVTNLKRRVADNRWGRDEKEWNSLTQEQKAEIGNQFRQDALMSIPLFKQFTGTDKITYSNADYQNLYREFQKDLIYKGQEEAFTNLQTKIQDHVAANMGPLETFGRLCLDWVDVVATDIAYIFATTGGYFYNGFAEGKWGINSVINNPATHYLNDVLASGTWDPSKQQEYINNGINENGVVWSTEQENNFFSAKLMGELFKQSGHLVGFTGGAGISQGIGKFVVEKSAKSSYKIADYMKKFQKATRNPTFSSDLVAKNVQAAKLNAMANKAGARYGFAKTLFSESVMEASNVYQEQIRTAEYKTKEMEDNAYYQYVDEQLDRDPRKFEAMYPTDGEPLADPSKNYFQYIDQLRTFMYNNSSARQRFYNNNSDLQNQIIIHQQAARESAETASMVTLGMNLVFNSLTNAMQKSLMPRSMRTYFDKHDIKIKRDPAKGWHASSSGGGKVSALWDGTKELGSQFIEEYGQNIYANVGKKVGEHLYNEKAVGAMSSELSEILAVAFQGVEEAALSREAIEEGLIGLFSSAIGMPGLKRPNKAKKGAEESTLDYYKRRNYVTWNSPILETIDQVKNATQEQQKEKQILHAVNTWLEDEDHQQALFDNIKRIEAIHEYTTALESGDPKAIAKAHTSLMYETAAMFVSLEGTQYYDAHMKDLHDQINVKIENLNDPDSYESQLVIELMNHPGNEGLTAEQCLQSVQEAATQVKSIIVDMKKLKKEFDKVFNSPDPVVMSMVIKSAALQNEYDRQRQREQQKIEQYQAQLPQTKKTKLSEDALNFILQFHSIEEAESFLSAEKIKIQEKIDLAKSELTASPDKKKRKAIERQIERYNQYITDLENNISKNRAEIEALPEDERIPSVNDILEFLKMK